MIFNKSEYNPLQTIFNIIPDTLDDLSVATLDTIQKELFQGGVVPETGEEFMATVNLLIQTFHKEYNGKK